MSDAQKTPLIDLLRSIPVDHRTQYECQWREDGSPTGHALSPVGRLMHEAADEIARLTTELAQQGTLDETVLFHKVPHAKVVLHQAGTYTVHDVYALAGGALIQDWPVFARKGTGYIRLYASNSTGKKGVVVHAYHLPFPVQGSKLGYLRLPEKYNWGR